MKTNSLETSPFFIGADDAHALGALEVLRYLYASTSTNRVSELRMFRDGVNRTNHAPAHGVVLLTASALQDGISSRLVSLSVCV